jgi:hypothetical protein
LASPICLRDGYYLEHDSECSCRESNKVIAARSLDDHARITHPQQCTESFASCIFPRMSARVEPPFVRGSVTTTPSTNFVSPHCCLINVITKNNTSQLF